MVTGVEYKVTACPHCHSDETKIVGTRQIAINPIIIRRQHRCDHCGRPFQSYQEKKKK